jgi:putative endonuclease
MQDQKTPEPSASIRRGHNRQVGEAGENAAVRYLDDIGIRAVERNWRCARGEIDIVADDHGTVVFVEVKCRTSMRTGHPFEAVTRTKADRLRRLAATWLAEHPASRAREVRLDVVAVHLASDGTTAIEHLRGVL